VTTLLEKFPRLEDGERSELRKMIKETSRRIRYTERVSWHDNRQITAVVSAIGTQSG
jgi:hypothetical protein